MRKQFFKHSLFLLLFFVYTLPALAGPGESGDGFDETDPAAPIDNWLYVVLILGIAFAFYQFNKSKNANLV